MMDLENRLEKRKIIRNLVVSSVWGFLLMCSAAPVESLQSTVNASGQIGTLSLSIGVGVSVIALFFVPYLANMFGLKKLVVVGSLAVAFYAISNTYPTPGLLITAAIIFKCFASVAMSSNYAIVTFFSESYAKLCTYPKEKIYSVIFGAAMTGTQLGGVAGAMMMFFTNNVETNVNVTTGRNDCGPYFVQSQRGDEHYTEMASTSTLYVLFGVLAIVALSDSAIVAFFLDHVPNSLQTSGNLAIETLRLTKNRNALLMIVCDFHRGMALGSLNADFSKAYSSCLGGIPLLGMSTMVLSLTVAVVSPLFSYLTKRFNRILVFAICISLECVTFSLLVSWKPNLFPDNRSFVLGTAFSFGVCGGGNSFLLYMFHGYLFPEMKEASMALCILAENIGISVSYGLSSILDVYTKLCIIFVTMTATCICYLSIEIPLARKKDSILNSSS